MKAYVLHGVNDLHFEETPIPQIKDDEVLVKVMAAGICGSDIPRIYRNGAHVHPLIPGHEFSGQVVQAGAMADKKWNGRRVGIFPLIPCRECMPCQKGQFEMCRHYNYLGSRCNGGFAEYAAVPQDNLIELPDSVAFEEGAMLEPMAVAVHAMRRIELNQSDTVVVCGLGTIGLLLTMFLIERGISNILVIGNKEFQRKQAAALGIPDEHYCDSSNTDAGEWIMHHTDGDGAGVFFECVGKNETFAQAVECTAPAGKIVIVGNPYSDMKLEQNVYWKLLRNQIELHGTWNSSFNHQGDDDWHYVLDKLKDKNIAPSKLISHSFSLEELEKGFAVMRDKTEDYIKIMCSRKA